MSRDDGPPPALKPAAAASEDGADVKRRPPPPPPPAPIAVGSLDSDTQSSQSDSGLVRLLLRLPCFGGYPRQGFLRRLRMVLRICWTIIVVYYLPNAIKNLYDLAHADLSQLQDRTAVIRALVLPGPLANPRTPAWIYIVFAGGFVALFLACPWATIDVRLEKAAEDEKNDLIKTEVPAQPQRALGDLVATLVHPLPPPACLARSLTCTHRNTCRQHVMCLRRVLIELSSSDASHRDGRALLLVGLMQDGRFVPMPAIPPILPRGSAPALRPWPLPGTPGYYLVMLRTVVLPIAPASVLLTVGAAMWTASVSCA